MIDDAHSDDDKSPGHSEHLVSKTPHVHEHTRSLDDMWMGKQGAKRLYYIKLFVDVVNGTQSLQVVTKEGIINCITDLMTQTCFLFMLPVPTLTLWFMLNKGFHIYGTSFGPAETLLTATHWAVIFQISVFVLNCLVCMVVYYVSFQLDKTADNCEFYIFSPQFEKKKVAVFALRSCHFLVTAKMSRRTGGRLCYYDLVAATALHLQLPPRSAPLCDGSGCGNRLCLEHQSFHGLRRPGVSLCHNVRCVEGRAFSSSAGAGEVQGHMWHTVM